ncbi:MAG TPA: type II toxin-antitoxin system HicA family toxin [Bryobacteraceae bacterium]|jgi:predicted RNA binding protein YcfA (HicA-like mRNA interferase family)
MPSFGPVKRADLIFYLHQAGFVGPYPGGKHEYLVKGTLRISVPNPHRGDVSRNLLARILRQADITREQWEKL